MSRLKRQGNFFIVPRHGDFGHAFRSRERVVVAAAQRVEEKRRINFCIVGEKKCVAAVDKGLEVGEYHASAIHEADDKAAIFIKAQTVDIFRREIDFCLGLHRQIVAGNRGVFGGDGVNLRCGGHRLLLLQSLFYICLTGANRVQVLTVS